MLKISCKRKGRIFLWKNKNHHHHLYILSNTNTHLISHSFYIHLIYIIIFFTRILGVCLTHYSWLGIWMNEWMLFFWLDALILLLFWFLFPSLVLFASKNNFCCRYCWLISNQPNQFNQFFFQFDLTFVWLFILIRLLLFLCWSSSSYLSFIHSFRPLNRSIDVWLVFLSFTVVLCFFFYFYFIKYWF